MKTTRRKMTETISPQSDGGFLASHRPIVFEPDVHAALWGDEEWLVSAHPRSPGRIVGASGVTLRDIWPGFPLLVKRIHAERRLSVQVHPDEAAAKIVGGEAKTEMWCVIEPGSIFAGFRSGVTRADVESAVHDGSFESLLTRFDAKVGECYFIPAGLVHAIGDGTTVYEVQQSSDTTFRLYDWGRVDANGRPRELHVEKALEAIDYSLPVPVPCKALETPFFAFRQERLSGEMHVGGVGRFTAIRSASGKFGLDGEEFPEGSSVLLPPSAAGTLRAASAWLFLTEWPV